MSTAQIIGGSLISGSGDNLRTAIGGTYSVVSASSETGGTITTLDFKEFKPVLPKSRYFAKVQSRTDGEYLQSIDSTTLFPNRKFPIRISGDGDQVLDDDEWKGLFENVFSYDRNRVHNNINMVTTPPVAFPESRHLEDAGMTPEKIVISYELNRYNPSYYNYSTRISSEFVLPNCYFLCDMADYDIYDADIDKFDPALINLVTCNGEYKDVQSLFTLNLSEMRADLGTVRSPKKLEMITTSKHAYIYSFLNTTYLTAALPQTNYPQEQIDSLRKKQRNILFDIDTVDKFNKTSPISEKMNYFPYYINITFPCEDIGDHYQSIKDNNFSSMFIKTISSVFGKEALEGSPQTAATRGRTIQTNRTKLAIAGDGYTVPEPNGIAVYTAGIRNASINNCEYGEFLEYCQNTSHDNTNGNYIFAGEQTIYKSCAMSLTTNDASSPTVNRYLKTTTTSGVISDMIINVSSSENYNAPSLNNIFTDEQNEVETLAYRIKKSSVDPAADSDPSGFIQNYWFMNSNIQDFNFYDTQVKYGVTYQYTVYAYRLVRAYRYKYSNLLLSRQLNCESDGSYGLEFYDYESGIKADQLYDLEGGRFQRLNDYATMAQVTSEYPFLADMYVEVEPYLSIVEIPILAKSIKMTDHWPSKVFARPYQVLDASHKVGFEMKLMGHEDAVYDTTFNAPNISAREYELYHDSNNLLLDDKVTKKSVSNIKFIDIYRTVDKPTSMLDFKNKEIHTLNLQISDSKDYNQADFFENIVDANRIYYYAFRARNELGVTGHFSDVYEVQLVNDGGYLYSIFKTHRADQLPAKPIKQTTKPIRKLLQFKPQFLHVKIDSSDADFASDAGTQIDNIKIGAATDPLWDKTFKLRLVSKKTNKKIDLNITYKLDSEY